MIDKSVHEVKILKVANRHDLAKEKPGLYRCKKDCWECKRESMIKYDKV